MFPQLLIDDNFTVLKTEKKCHDATFSRLSFPCYWVRASQFDNH